MRLAPLVVVVAACYAPHVPAGVACDVSTACPIGQQCMAGACRAGGEPAPDAAAAGDAAADASADAPAIGPDQDGDGVTDAVDDCPDVANADQGNEDGDRFGDACDPCPIVADDAPPDADGDGVADACDPHPQQAGDSLLVFEGFHHGVPSGWQLVGGATQLGDDLELDAGNAVAALAAPVPPPASGELIARIVVEQTHGTNDAGIGAAFGFGSSSGPALSCELYAPDAGMTSNHATSLYDYPADKELASGNLVWQTGTAYTVALARQGTSYTCIVLPDGGAPVAITGTSGSATPNKLALEEFGATSRVAWLMAIASP